MVSRGRASAELTVNYLFAQDSKPVLLASESAEYYEDLVLRIWLYLWPPLRMNFAFSTGSLSAREVNGAALDLQVVPGERAASVQRRSDGLVVFRNQRHTPATNQFANP